MNHSEPRWDCSVYEQLTGRDASPAKIRQRTGEAIDPPSAIHRCALSTWLNGWARRQSEHHATTASDSLVEWANESLVHLPALDVPLTDLAKEQMWACSRAYDELTGRAASYRLLPGGDIESLAR